MATDTAALAPPRSDPARNLWQLPVLLLGVAAFVCAWKGWVPPLGARDPGAGFSQDVAALKLAYEKAAPDAQELKNLLGKVAQGLEARPEQAATGHFHLGSGYVRLAEITPALDESRGYWALALQHFERVTDKQLRDPADGPRLVFRTAKARAAVGLPENVKPEELGQLIAILSAAQAEEAGETQRLVAELALRLGDAARAKVALTQYLTSTGFATPSASLARARLLLGTLYIQSKEYEQARKWLREVGSDAPPEVLAPAKAALAKVLVAEGNWLEAAKELELLRGAPGVPPAIRQEAAYQLAACRLKMNEREAAARLFEEAAKGDGPEAPAAAIQLARLKLEGKGRAAHKSAVDLLAGAVKGVTGPAGYDGRLVRLDEAQAAFELAVATLLSDGDYESALAAAEKYAAVAPPGRDREKRAEVLGAWAESMLKDKKGDPKPKLKQAADEFAALAAYQPKPEGKAEMLRRSAELSKKAGDSAASAERLAEALALKELPEPLLQAILFDLADAKLAAGRPEDVLKIFNQIMAAGPNELSTAARYRLARAFVDSRHAALVPVGRLLFEQVADQKGVSAAEREYHERSLTELANALIRDGNFAEAEARLRKQLGIYPNGPEAPLAKLLLGVCLLQRAAAPNLSAADANQMRTEALANFKQIVADCDAAERRRKLTDREAWLRLQASLRVLQAHQQMRKPVELLSDAAPLLDRYKTSVEELIILSLVYHAFKQLNDPGKALDTRARMKETFDRLPPSAFPQKDGEYSRDYWLKVWFPPEKQ